MNQNSLETCLKHLPLGGIRFCEQSSSTNDEAAAWIKTGCPDLALVVADEQTAGRGRMGRKWFTPAGSALAFSLVLQAGEQIGQLLAYQNTARLNGLGALAVCRVLQQVYKLPAQIKWPNDIIINDKKLSGVLAETHWIGNELVAVVLGIGINVATKSVPPVNWDMLNPHPFPATCVESLLGMPVKRCNLLSAVLKELLVWCDQLAAPEFLMAWQADLAFQGEWVQVVLPGLDATTQVVQIMGLDDDGALRIQDKSGKLSTLRTGELHPADPPFGGFRLRSVDSSKK
jgi:BirA family biotin operon repressor/biotin-[acetyl-CoA-carboxylase] ligase